MPPKPRKSTRRSNRIQDRSSEVPSDPPQDEPVERKLDQEMHNAKERGEQVYEEPRGPQPMGLHPMHDGSYGMNTIVPSDVSRLRKSHKSKPKFANEVEEDTRFMKEVDGPKGTKKNRANANNTRPAYAETMVEARTEDVMNAAMAQLESDDDQPRPNDHGGNDDSPPPDGSGFGGAMQDSHPKQFRYALAGPDQTPAQPVPRPRRIFPPRWPFNEDEVMHDLVPKGRTLIKSQLPNPNLTPYNQRRHPSEPPTSLSSKYGVPVERYSSVPSSSPSRPDTSRSFNHESLLVQEASIQTPRNTIPLTGPRSGPPTNLGEIQEQTEDVTKPVSTSAPDAGSKKEETKPKPKLKNAIPHKSAPTVQSIQSQQDGITRRSKSPELGTQSRSSRKSSHSTQEDTYEDEEDEDEEVDEDQRSRSPTPSPPREELSTQAPLTGALVKLGAQKPVPDSTAKLRKPASNTNVRPFSEKPVPNTAAKPSVQETASGISGKLPLKQGPHHDPRRRRSPSGEPIADRPVEYLDCNCVSLLKMLALFLAGLALISTLLSIGSGGNFRSQRDTYSPDSSSLWSGLTNLPSTVGQFIPRYSFGDKNVSTIFNRLSGQASEIGKLRKSNKELGQAVESITRELPDVIKVEKDNKGNIKVPSSFWLALRDLMYDDESILTLMNADTSSPEVSGKHWEAIKFRLQKNGSLKTLSTGNEEGNSETNLLSKKDIERIMDDKLSNNWKDWVRKNKDELAKLIGFSKADKISSMPEKNVKEILKKLDGTYVTRKDFGNLVKKELSDEKREFKKQLEDSDAKVKEFSQRLEKLSKSIPKSWTEADIKDLIEAAVNDAQNKAKISAASKTGVQKQLGILETQVNFFTRRRGATIDPTNSSPTWQPPKHRVGTQGWLKRDGYKALSASEVFEPWDGEEGACFCAGPTRQGQGTGTANISVLLPEYVAPRHIVVEHILRGATLDPDAIPKNMELWASYEEVTLRHGIQSWSDIKWPNAAKDERKLDVSYVKIGEFTYDRTRTADGIELWELDEFLITNRAASNHFVVRALNNYGADHTCIYRLRMFGDMQEEVTVEEEKKDVSK